MWIDLSSSHFLHLTFPGRASYQPKPSSGMFSNFRTSFFAARMITPGPRSVQLCESTAIDYDYKNRVATLADSDPHDTVEGMEIAFSTKSLRDTCESEEMLRQKFGPEVAEMLKRRLADLRAASSIKDIVLGNVREVPGTGGLAMCVDLFDGYRLDFGANHIHNPTLATGKVDWSAVSRIKITRIERPNE